jgi:hypothetical protein
MKKDSKNPAPRKVEVSVLEKGQEKVRLTTLAKDSCCGGRY